MVILSCIRYNITHVHIKCADKEGNCFAIVADKLRSLIRFIIKYLPIFGMNYTFIGRLLHRNKTILNISANRIRLVKM